MERKPMVSWYDECLQVSLLKLAQIAITRHLTVEEVKAYFDEILRDLEEMKALDKKEASISEENALS